MAVRCGPRAMTLTCSPAWESFTASRPPIAPAPITQIRMQHNSCVRLGGETPLLQGTARAIGGADAPRWGLTPFLDRRRGNRKTVLGNAVFEQTVRPYLDRCFEGEEVSYAQ